MPLQGAFAVDNLLALWQRLPPAEQARYPFALDRIPWRDYLWNTHLPGIRKCASAAIITTALHGIMHLLQALADHPFVWHP